MIAVLQLFAQVHKRKVDMSTVRLSCGEGGFTDIGGTLLIFDVWTEVSVLRCVEDGQNMDR